MKKQEVSKVVEELRGVGMTVAGWARTRGFPLGSVKNVLYRGQTTGPSSEAIIAKLEEDGLI